MPDTTFIEKIRGKRNRNINLPSEGTVDPRLPPRPIEQLRKAFDVANKIAAESDPLEGLRKAGKSQR